MTSIDAEHLDHYGSLENVRKSFLEFANKVPFYGSVIASSDDPQIRHILPHIKRRVRTYGITSDADLTASKIEYSHLASQFELCYQGKNIGAFQVRGAGQHDVQNAMASVLIGLELGLAVDSIREGLFAFSGVDRRFQVRGTSSNITVVDDYAHHPTEIRATLAAARNCNFANIHVIFQPHRHTRTNTLLLELAACFGNCDRLYVVDIYGAGEQPIGGVDSIRLVEEIKIAGHTGAIYCSSMQDACTTAVEKVTPGDVLITLGAGDVWQAGEQLLSLLGER